MNHIMIARSCVYIYGVVEFFWVVNELICGCFFGGRFSGLLIWGGSWQVAVK